MRAVMAMVALLLAKPRMMTQELSAGLPLLVCLPRANAFQPHIKLSKPARSFSQDENTSGVLLRCLASLRIMK
jgi:hypothetical protein